MGYTALPISQGKQTFTQQGFESKIEAMRYIEALCCNHCISDVRQGYYIDEVEGVDVKNPIQDILDTSCGAEWLIITDKEYDEAEDFEDYLIAGGMTPGNEETREAMSEEKKEKVRKKQEEIDAEKKKRESAD